MAQQTGGTRGGTDRPPTGGTQTTNVQTYLKGCTFPCGREDIIKQAKKNNAPTEVIERFRQLPDQRFKNENEVREVFGRVPARQGEGREAITPGGRSR